MFFQTGGSLSHSCLPTSHYCVVGITRGKGHAIYGDYAYGGVLFDNVTIGLGPEEPGYLEQGHRRAWLMVESDDGLKNLNLSATVVAGPGSGGCKLAKVECGNAKGPWERVDLNFTCRDVVASA